MDRLPHELWLSILTHLPHSCLCSVALTSRHLHATASDPSLWATAKLSKRKGNAAKISSIFEVARFSKMTHVDLSNMEVTSQQMSAFLEASLATFTMNLQQLDLCGINLSKVGAGLLARGVSRLQKVSLQSTILTQRQATVLFSHMITSTTLMDVNLNAVNLYGSAEVLGLAVSRLTRLNLASTIITTNQVVSLLTQIAASKTLMDVNLGYVNLGLVPGDVLSKGVAGLSRANLEQTRLTGEQCVPVFKEILNSKTLEEINLANVHLTQVPADLLGMAIATLVKADLKKTQLTREQFTSLMTHSLTSTTLEDLNLFYFEEKGPTPLPIADAVISQAVSRLKIVDLGGAALSRLHTAAVFKEILSTKTLLDLSLQDVNLSRVSASLLADAVSLLRNVDLSLTKLTTEQLTAIFTGVISSKTLKGLALLMVDLSKITPDLLANTVVRLNSVALSELTTMQSTAIFTNIQNSPSVLEDLNLQNGNLSQVSPQLVGEAVAKMRKATLATSKLTTDQLTAVLKHSIKSRKVKDINLVGNNISEVQVNLFTRALEATNINYSKNLTPGKLFHSRKYVEN